MNLLCGLLCALKFPAQSKITRKFPANAQIRKEELSQKLSLHLCAFAGNFINGYNFEAPLDSNTSDLDRHVDPRISKSKRYHHSLGRFVAHRLYPLRDDG